MTRLPNPHILPESLPRHYPIDWGEVATMGLILAVECGAVMGIVEWYRRHDELSSTDEEIRDSGHGRRF